MTASRSRSLLLLNVLVVFALLLSSTPLAVASPPAAASAAEVQDASSNDGASPLRSTAPETDLAFSALLPSADSTLTPTLSITPTLTVTPTVTLTPTVTPTSTPALTLTLTPTPTVAPVLTPTLSPAPSTALSLSKSVTPTIALSGEVVTFTLVVTNAGAAPAQGLILHDALPNGLEYVPGSAPGARYDPEARLLTWELPELDTGQALALPLAAEVASASGEELANVATLSIAGGAEPLTATATVEVGWTTAPDQVLITPKEGGVLASADGWVEVQVPPGAVTEPVLLSYRAVFTDTVGSEYVFALDMVTLETGMPVANFLRPVTLRVRYTAEIVKALRGRQLQVLAFDQEAGRWAPLDSQVDEAAQRVTARTDRTGLLSLTESTDDEGAVTGILQPSVLGVQSSLWTGDASFGYAIETPPGPGGFGPAVSLSYSSGAANGMLQQIGNDHLVQAGFPGLGWNLGALGYISRINQDKYYLSFAGGSFELYDWDHDGWWTTDPESFLKIYHKDGTNTPTAWEAVNGGCPPEAPFLGQARVIYADTEPWTVWTKDGTQFKFGSEIQTVFPNNGIPVDLGATPIKWGGSLACGYVCYTDQGMNTCGDLTAQPYRWNLTEVRDTHANAYQVSYAHDLQTITNDTEYCPNIGELIQDRSYVRDSRPTAITYGDNGQFKVEFVAANDRNDIPSGLDLGPEFDQTPCNNQAVFTEWRLDQIRVQALVSSAWQDLRVYDLGGHRQGNHWVLDTVSWTGSGGTEASPPYTFAYATKEAGNGVFLSQASNGYGGSTALSYQHRETDFPACGCWVVSQRAVADGLGNTANVGYAYQDEDAASWQCRDPEYEFLGFGTATQTVYDLNSASSVDHKIVTEFHQEDNALKGKEKKVQVRGPDDSLLRQTQNDWALSGTWAYLYNTTATSCDSGACQSKHTTYHYDQTMQGGQQYGNLTRILEYDENGLFYRATRRIFHALNEPGDTPPGTTVYMVDRMQVEIVSRALYGLDYSDMLSLAWYTYDGQNLVTDPLGDHGDLTRVQRIQYDGVSDGYHWFDTSDVTYTYDGFGNRLTETVYREPGRMRQLDGSSIVSWVSYPGDPLTTTIEYDDDFHVFPLTVTNPLQHEIATEYYGVDDVDLDHGSGGFFGQVKSTTDANGLTTGYKHDSFGRVTKEIRPGDDENLPSTEFEYRQSPWLLIPNNGFETSGTWCEPDTSVVADCSYDSTWCEYDPSTPEIQEYAFDTTQAYTGNRSVKIVTYDAVAPHWVGSGCTTAWQPGATYWFSAYVKADSGRQFCLNLSAKGGHEASAGCVTTTGAWQRVQGAITLPPDATRFWVLLRTHVAGTYYVDDVQVGRLYEVGTYTKEDSLGNTVWSRNVYDGLGQLIQEQAERDGNQAIVLHRTYDELGQLALQTVPEEMPSTETGFGYIPPTGSEAATSYQYDSLGRTTQVTQPDGSETLNAYNIWQEAIIDAEGHLLVYEKDAFGRLIRAHEYTGQHSTPVWDGSGAYATTQYGYDRVDNLTVVTDTLGITTTMQYDMLGRKQAMHDPDMGDWSYSYDALGNLLAQTDAKGQLIGFAYDGLNRLVEKDYGDDGSPEARYYYDGDTCPATDCPIPAGKMEGQQTAVWTPGSWAIYNYDDPRGRLSSEVRSIDGAPGGPFETGYTYDVMDRPVTMTMPDGEPLTTAYNAQGLPVTLAGDETYVSGTGYSALGQVTQLTMGNGATTTYSYYPSETGNNRLWKIQVGGGSLLDLEYSYDEVGNVAQIVDGQAQTQTFAYDALDRLTGASAQAGGPWVAYTGSYAYDPVGNLTLKAEGGITHTLEYNDPAHVHAVSAVDGVAQTYDANGNMTVRVVDGVTYTQGWDHENRLAWASTGGLTTTFTYDAHGALVKKEDPLAGTTYYVGPHYEVLVPAVLPPPAPAAPTDLEACRASGSPPNVCNYLSWTGSAGVTYNVYRSNTSPVPIDAGHRIDSGLTETEYTDCGKVYNRYYAVTAVNENGESDPSNEDRASQPCGGSAAISPPAVETGALADSGGEPVVTKYYFFGGMRVAMDREGVVWYLVVDHLGTTSLVLNGDGTVHSEARHYPYGEERWSSGTLPTDYRFTGQRVDLYIRLVHMGARFYDPALGRWISADTIVPEPANPQTFNRYSYVLGNPLRYIDPTGHFSDEELAGFLGFESVRDMYDDPLWELWSSDDSWMEMVAAADYGDILVVERVAGVRRNFMLCQDEEGLAMWDIDAGLTTLQGLADIFDAAKWALFKNGSKNGLGDYHRDNSFFKEGSGSGGLPEPTLSTDWNRGESEHVFVAYDYNNFRIACNVGAVVLSLAEFAGAAGDILGFLGVADALLNGLAGAWYEDIYPIVYHEPAPFQFPDEL